MYCSKCGKENQDQARFCAYCGAPLETGESTEAVRDREKAEQKTSQKISQKKKKRKWPWILAIILILAAAGTAGVLIFKGQYVKKQFSSAVEDGNRYLEELDYEKAEASYLKAISVDPKEKEPYLKLADLYLADNRVEEAKAIVHQAAEQTASEYQPEFEDLEEEWKDLEEYALNEDQEVEADDIYYLRDQDNVAYSQNDLKRQLRSEYAVIRQGDSYGLIDMEGNLLEGMAYSKVETIMGYYCMTTKEPRYLAEYGTELNEFYLTDQGVQSTVAAFGDAYGVQGTYYYCGELKNTLTTVFGTTDEASHGAFWDLKPLENAIPVIQTDESMDDAVAAGRTDRYSELNWLAGISSKYAVWGENQLLTDFIYDECGSASSGLLAVEKDGKWGYVNEQGEEVIPIEYDASWDQYVPVASTEAEPYCYAASDGYVTLVKDGQWELRNTEGALVIAPGVFEAIRPVYDGKCWVKQNGIWKVIEIGVSADNESGDDKEEKSKEETEDEDASVKTICDSVTANYGVVTGDEFMSCEAAQVSEFPDAETGYISHYLGDLDEDGVEELLVTYLDPDSKYLMLQIYAQRDGAWKFMNGVKMAEMDAFSQVTMYLFYNEKEGQYQVFCSNNTVGSYTGTYGVTTSLVGVAEGDLLFKETRAWNSAVGTWEEAEDIKADMQKAGVPYLNAGNISFGKYDRTEHTMLAQSDVRVEGDVPAMYTVYMHVYSEKQLKLQ